MKILITGASSEISKALAERRKGLGDAVYLTSRKKTKEAFAWDLNEPHHIPEDMKKLIEKNLDAVVLNAVTDSPDLRKLHKLPFKEAQEFLRANIEGNLALLQMILPAFCARKFGRIIFVSSQMINYPMAGYGIYTAAKSAMESLIKNIAVEYGRFNITANVVRLGIFETARNQKYRENPKLLEKMVKSISLKRLGRPSEAAEAFDPLLSKTSYIQGSVIEVTGGLHIPSETSES